MRMDAPSPSAAAAIAAPFATWALESPPLYMVNMYNFVNKRSRGILYMSFVMINEML
jgi:hypothetical protein